MLGLLIPALDALPATVQVFVRDDDAGWEDARLLALLDVMQRAGVPIDLAAIPAAVGPALASELCGRIDRAPGLVAVHQHGLHHFNYETAGRKCEFGAARGVAVQRADLVRGRAMLAGLLGARLQPWFTPPWNRCSAATPGLLADLGFRCLSRDRGAAPAQDALPELPVDVDWSRHWREGGAAAVAGALARALRARAADGAPLGLMLHHGVMAREERQCLAELLAVASHHPRLRWRGMGELLASYPAEVLACAPLA
jgi:peptidoglycan/xylan/chitin deacetylase (PgdA/CDA1 family)